MFVITVNWPKKKLLNCWIKAILHLRSFCYTECHYLPHGAENDDITPMIFSITALPITYDIARVSYQVIS